MKTMKSFYAFPCPSPGSRGRLVRAGISGKPSLDVATPPEFKGAARTRGARRTHARRRRCTSCFTVTFLAVAERRGIAVHDLGVDAVGRMGLRELAFGFLGVDLTACVVTDAGQEEAAVRGGTAR